MAVPPDRGRMNLVELYQHLVYEAGWSPTRAALTCGAAGLALYFKQKADGWRELERADRMAHERWENEGGAVR